MGGKVSKILVKTLPGLENIAIDEITSLVGAVKCAIEGKGRVLVEGNGLGEKLKELLEKAKIAEHVIYILWEGKFSDLTELENLISQSVEALSPYISPWLSFSVEAERIETEILSSVELASAVGRAIEMRFEKLQVKVCLDDPDIVIYACVKRDRYVLGIYVTAFRPLHERRYRIYIHPSMLNPVVANAMLTLAEDPRTLLDPFCGSGTILIERARRGEYDMLIGMDVSYRHVYGAKLNAKTANVDVNLLVGDINLHPFRNLSSTVEAIVTNPPYGIREKPVGGLGRIYKALFEVARSFGVKLVVITPHKRIAEKYGKKLRRKKSLTINQGGLTSFIYVYET